MKHFLNKDGVTILKIKKKNKKFHARFSAKLRIYKYIIINEIKQIAINGMEIGKKKLFKSIYREISDYHQFVVINNHNIVPSLKNYTDIPEDILHSNKTIFLNYENRTGQSIISFSNHLNKIIFKAKLIDKDAIGGLSPVLLIDRVFKAEKYKLK